MYGEDSFSLSEELAKWKKLFEEKYGSNFNIEEFHGENLKIGELVNSVNSAPFLSEKRMIIVKNFLSSQKSEAQSEMQQAIQKIPESSVLIFAETLSPDKRFAFFKYLTTNANVYLYSKPKDVQLNNWVVKRVLINEGQIDFQSANYLIATVGNDLWSLEKEIQKLCLYARGKIINKEMIDELVTGNIEESIFNLTDQMAKKNQAGVLNTIKKLEEQGEEAPFIFSMIARQFRLMLEIKSLSEMRLSENAIAGKMGVHPFVVTNTVRQCKNFTYGQLKSGLQKLLEIDRALKSGRINYSAKNPDHYLLAIEKVLLTE